MPNSPGRGLGLRPYQGSLPNLDNLPCLLPKCINVDAGRTQGDGSSLPFSSPFAGSATVKVVCVGEHANLLSFFTKLCLTTIYYSGSSRLKFFSGKALQAALQRSWVEQSKACRNRKPKCVFTF